MRTRLFSICNVYFGLLMSLDFFWSFIFCCILFSKEEKGKMKAIIMAAGLGTRLAPFTDQLPKPLMPVNGKPVIVYQLEWLAQNNIKEVGINLFHLGEKIEKFLGDGSDYEIRITYNKQEELSGTGGDLKKFEDFIEDENFILINGDNLFVVDFNDFQEVHDNKGGIGTLYAREWEDPTRRAIIDIDHDNKIRKFKEKPKPDEVFSNIAVSGLYIFENKILEYIPEGEFTNLSYDIIPKVLASGEEIYAYIDDGYFADIGNPSGYIQAQIDMFRKSHEV
ncbi:NTP transferase domain-containing protein [Candidatus Dojkabacteria bacterium]|nr:NTP transferase domain-containing protein [Candidatus Dojkabacteria bacterium]